MAWHSGALVLVVHVCHNVVSWLLTILRFRPQLRHLRRTEIPTDFSSVSRDLFVLTMPRTFFSKTMPDSACKYTFSDLRYFTFTRFFDGTPRVRAPAAPRLISQLFPLFHLLPSRRQYLSSFVCESTHKIATFREDLVTADDNGTNIRGNWANYCLPVGSNQACPKNKGRA